MCTPIRKMKVVYLTLGETNTFTLTLEQQSILGVIHHDGLCRFTQVWNQGLINHGLAGVLGRRVRLVGRTCQRGVRVGKHGAPRMKIWISTPTLIDLYSSKP